MTYGKNYIIIALLKIKPNNRKSDDEDSRKEVAYSESGVECSTGVSPIREPFRESLSSCVSETKYGTPRAPRKMGNICKYGAGG